MEDFFLADMERRLDYLERALDRPGRVKFATREIERFLMHLHRRFAERPGRSRLDPVMHRSLHNLMSRAHKTRSAEDARDLMRDIRQFQLALSSMNRTWDVESRLRELEEQAKAAPEVLNAPDADAEAEPVTVDSLKNKKLLFAIMPFAQEFSDIWIGGIKRAASGTGLTAVRIDMLTQSSEITDDIVKAIRMAEVVVIDVTGNNANVMFEFGFTLALNKKLVVISQSTEYLTFDIKNLRTLIYRNTWQGIENLHKDLQPFIKGALGKGSQKSKRKEKADSKNS